MPDTHFGVYDQAVPTPEEAARAFEHVLEEAETAERVGFDGIFIPNGTAGPRRSPRPR